MSNNPWLGIYGRSTDKAEIDIAGETITREHLDRLADWLKTYPRLTRGPMTEQFEDEWSRAVGCNYSVFVNSGSSANLLMFAALVERGVVRKKPTIVVPALCWATDLAPVMQLGMKAVLCDCNEKDLSLDLNCLETILSGAKHYIDAVLLVSVLGLPPDMGAVRELCDKYRVVLLEDACESIGSGFNNAPMGSFGLMSTFSFYWGHHISTIEGGMICTNDQSLAEILHSLRSHGWGREFLEPRVTIDEWNEPYTFYYPGYNVRSTDLQAYIGLMQLKNLPRVMRHRHDLFKEYHARSESMWRPQICARATCISCFGYPFIQHRRREIQRALAMEKIESRPLMAGNIAEHPAWESEFRGQHFPVATRVRRDGFYVPCHQDMSVADVIRICDIVTEAS